MPPNDVRVERNDDYLNIVVEDEQEFEDIRTYGLSSNVSSPSIYSQLSRNSSSPMEIGYLSQNTSSPAVSRGLSANTSSPLVGSIGNFDWIDTDDNNDEIYEFANYIGTEDYEEYGEYGPGEIRIGITEEEGQVQSIMIHEDDIEQIQEILDALDERTEEVEIPDLESLLSGEIELEAEESESS